MNKKDKTEPVKSSGSPKIKKPLKEHEEFNTGVHSPESLRNVGPGYDDTGMGNGSQTSKRKQKNTSQENNTTEKVRNLRTKRARSRNRQY